MKKATFALAVLILLAMPALTQSDQSDDGPRCRGHMMMGKSMPASKLAEIRVYPMQQFKQDQQDVARIQQLVRALRQDGNKSDASTKDRTELENELFNLIDAHLERYNSDRGKSETAVAVQTKLNRMEGKMMCGACHGMGRGMGAMHNGTGGPGR